MNYFRYIDVVIYNYFYGHFNFTFRFSFQMCLNQKCVPVEDVRAAIYPEARPADCHKNGVCNSKGHCHCKVGFAPPFCEFSGPGGSEDSGPASHPNGMLYYVISIM